jgi:hypothetical protein
MAKDLRRRIQQAVTGAAPPADLSYAQRRTLLQDAVKERFSSVTPDGGLAPDGHGMGPWIADVFDDRVIVEDGKGGYFEIGYTIADDKAALGADMTAVERKVDITYPAVQESGRLLQAVEGKEGWAWDVVLIKAGTSKTNDHFPVATLAAAVSVFEGARAFALDQGQHVKNSLDKAVKDIVGWYSDVKMVGDEMRARLNLLKTAVWLRDMLVDSFAKGKTDLWASRSTREATPTRRRWAGRTCGTGPRSRKPVEWTWCGIRRPAARSSKCSPPAQSNDLASR